MLSASAPGNVTQEMYEVAALALSRRPGEVAAQYASRTRQMVHATLSFSPRTGRELMLAIMSFGHYEAILEMMRMVHTGPDEKPKFRAVAAIASLDRGLLGMMRELREAQAKPLAPDMAPGVAAPSFDGLMRAETAAAEPEPEPTPPPARPAAQPAAPGTAAPQTAAPQATRPQTAARQAAAPQPVTPHPAMPQPVATQPVATPTAMPPRPVPGTPVPPHPAIMAPSPDQAAAECARLRTGLMASASPMAAVRGQSTPPASPPHPASAQPSGRPAPSGPRDHAPERTGAIGASAIGASAIGASAMGASAKGTID
jgi:hypothetical protein